MATDSVIKQTQSNKDGSRTADGWLASLVVSVSAHLERIQMKEGD